MRRLFVLTALLFALPAHAVDIDWVEVGDPGNACEVQPPSEAFPGGCFGAVPYTYLISKYEVTNAQYAEFLNAVADTDTYGLYHTNMGVGGITRSGSPGSYTYSAIAGREDMPVNYVSSFHAALRFANWLHNGQPTGAQDSTTTEDGAYTMIAESYPDGPFITRNHDATIFLPSEDEWYKAAYFNGTGYFDYPAGSDTPTTCAPPGATANTANCGGLGNINEVTIVGSYTGSASPAGTFDQGGNVWEWNEAIIFDYVRGLRGGSFFYHDASRLAASFRYGDYATGLGAAKADRGFRVAKAPYPGCDDGRDNDGDGAIDWNGGPLGEPADPGCWDANDYSENDPSLPCDDGDDNDVDGLTDYPADPGCADILDASEKDDTETYPCDDGTDNDGDGQVDHPGDPGCASSWDESETDDTGAFPCDDGLDNENPGDTLVDFRADGSGDPGCRDAGWPTEEPGCQDGEDNDGDGDIDFDGGLSVHGVVIADPDPNCLNPWKHREVPYRRVLCGLGSELVLLLPPLMWLSRRRRRSLN